jgi:hypothetical protein
MAWKTFDFICTNEKCREYSIKKEIMVKDSEKNSQICGFCGNNLNLAFGVGAIKTADNNNRLKI